ncbi:MAG: hypothetical protein HPY89_06060 [Pelotomaculum sp.]|nr:hypothetical protein [Pelotomaculum sp.]
MVYGARAGITPQAQKMCPAAISKADGSEGTPAATRRRRAGKREAHRLRRQRSSPERSRPQRGDRGAADVYSGNCE